MFIVDIIPLTYLPRSQPQILSYFSREKLVKGAVVEVPLGKRSQLAAVVKSTDVLQKKASLKKADFAIRKINTVLCSEGIVPPLFFSLANFISHYYYSSLSLSLKTILPKNLKSLIKYFQKQSISPTSSFSLSEKTESYSAKISIGKDYNHIKKNILSVQGQVLILVPTVFHQRYYEEKLKKEKQEIYSYSRSGRVKEINSLWTRVATDEAKIVIGSRSAVFLPWNNLQHIFINEGNHSAYKSWDQRPYYNAVTLAQRLAFYYNAEITYC